MSDNEIVTPTSRGDLVTRAARTAIARARERGADEVTPDDLLAGALLAVSRFGIAWIGELAIDLETLNVTEIDSETAQKTKVAYSAETAAVFDRAAAIAKRDASTRVDAVHLLAAFAGETIGLMGELKRRYQLDSARWRATLARWPREGASAAYSAAEAPPTRSGKEFFTPEEAAEFLELHIQTVRGYVRSGKLPAVRVAGERAIRIRREDLLRLLEPVESSADGKGD